MSTINDAYTRLIAEGRTGFTLGADGCEVNRNSGYAVGLRPLTSPTEAEGLLGPTIHLGLWKEYLDLVEIFAGKATAILAAELRKQLAIYDFENGAVIRIGSSNEEGTDAEALSQATGALKGSTGG